MSQAQSNHKSSRLRIDEIDFWRGMALITIFINHFQGNFLSIATPKNYGFSDSAEAFVFLSGISAAIAYRKYFISPDFIKGCLVLLFRTVRVYAVHIVLTIAAILLYWIASHFTNIAEILEVDGRGTIFVSPSEAITGILGLTHQLGYFNILPLYVLFLMFSPAIFLIGIKNRTLMLFISLGIYICARVMSLNMPSWPESGGWYFNPLTWQLLFSLGVYFGLEVGKDKLKISQKAYKLSMLFTIVAAIIVSNGFGLVPGLVDKVGQYVDWDKTHLGIIRIIDFVALAYLIYASGITHKIKRSRLYMFAEIIGRNGLLIYCLGSLLSAGGTVIKEAYALTAGFDVLFVAFGIKTLYLCATLSEKLEYSFAKRKGLKV